MKTPVFGLLSFKVSY